MKILKFLSKKSFGQYKIDEYTVPLGAIIFDDSKGGSVSNSFSFRFSKSVGEKLVSGPVSSQAGSFINFYINAKSHQFQLIDFVGLKHFEVRIDENLMFMKPDEYFEPVIDISTWVSPFGGIQNIQYADKDKQYLNKENQTNVQVIHNNRDTFQLLFGNVHRVVNLNDQIAIGIDKRMNLSTIIIFDKLRVPKLLQELTIQRSR